METIANNNNPELQLLRNQFSVLKEKVDTQAIVNEELMRKVMSNKWKEINRNSTLVRLITIVGIAYCTWIFATIHMSTPFIVGTATFMLLALGYNLYCHTKWGIYYKEWLEGDLVVTGRKVAQFKLMKTRWLKVSIPAVCGWFAWFCYEVLNLNNRTNEFNSGLIIGGMVGGLAGAIIGYSLYHREQQRAASIIAQIAELTTS